MIFIEISSNSLFNRKIRKSNCVRLTHLCHLAAQAGVRHSINNAPENILINITGTINLLELIKDTNIPLTFASSSSVYGQSSTAPFSEDQVCDQPISPYAATKRSCELKKQL